MLMPLRDEECLALYEEGAPRHAIDRALLLASTMGDVGGDAQWGAVGDAEGHAGGWADRPLGLRDARLLALRRAWFGSRFDAVVACPACKALLSVALDLRSLDACVPERGDAVLRTAAGRFRRPTSRDLAAIATAGDVHEASRRLLDRLALDGPPEGGWADEQIEAVETALDLADPLAHVTIDLQCEHCGHRWQAPLDIAAVLWDELAARAQGVVRDVHLLASAYGWSESQILAMAASRRQLYLQQVLA